MLITTNTLTLKLTTTATHILLTIRMLKTAMLTLRATSMPPRLTTPTQPQSPTLMHKIAITKPTTSMPERTTTTHMSHTLTMLTKKLIMHTTLITLTPTTLITLTPTTLTTLTPTTLTMLTPTMLTMLTPTTLTTLTQGRKLKSWCQAQWVRFAQSSF